MMTVKHRKTYTLEVEINKIDKEYEMLRDANDKRESEPFKYMEEIGKIIENDLRPLVPFKKVCGWSYRIYVAGRDEVVHITVTFYLSNHNVDFI